MSFDLRLTNGDLSIKNGDVETITGSDKLVQDILKIAITQAGTNPYAPWYGSLISRTLIGAHLDDQIIISAAESQLQLALNTLQTLQIKQVELRQPMVAAEQIAAILDISVERNSLDPRLFDVRIKVLTKSFKKVDASFTVTTL